MQKFIRKSPGDLNFENHAFGHEMQNQECISVKCVRKNQWAHPHKYGFLHFQFGILTIVLTQALSKS